MDELARALDVDPVELRRRADRGGRERVRGSVRPDGIKETLERAVG
jgi:CO/xanthine dehydrogenase Mo-binding subunit